MPTTCCDPSSHANRRAPVLCGVALSFVSWCGAFAADPSGAAAPPEANDLARALWYDSELTFHLRSYYLNREISPAPTGPAGWANGGWIGYRSGWLADTVRFGIVGYTSLPAWAPESRNGSLLFLPNRDAYAVVGEAYGQIKVWEQVFTGYRQKINEPEVNPQDNRMTPNTFEAYMVAGKFWDVSYNVGYVARIKPRNENQFFNMAYQAGAPLGVSEGMWLGTLSYSPIKDLTARVSSYTVPDILTSTYTDFVWRTALTDDLKLQVGAQYMYQTSNGDDLLTGSSFDTWAAGAKVDLIYGPVTGTVAYTKLGDGANYRSPYGSWAGYTSMIVKDFNRANEGAFLVGAAVDFAPINLPGMSFTTNLVFGNDAIDPATGAPASRINEYDFTLDYRFTASYWPEALRPLWLRARYAYVDEKPPAITPGPTKRTDDFRIIANYEWVIKQK